MTIKEKCVADFVSIIHGNMVFCWVTAATLARHFASYSVKLMLVNWTFMSNKCNVFVFLLIE